MTCCFFGSRDTPSSILPALRNTIRRAVNEYGADRFLVGNQGNFDFLAQSVLQTCIKEEFPFLRYNVVLAYMPGTDPKHEPKDSSITIYPEGLEKVPPRFAILRRNQWMTDHSDIVICHVTHSWGGAAKAVEYAEKKKKIILPIQ